MSDRPPEKSATTEESSTILQMKTELAEKDARIHDLEHTINAITATRGWRFLEKLRKMKGKVLPADGLIRRMFNLALRSQRFIRREGLMQFIRHFGRRYDIAPSLFADESYRLWFKKNEPGEEEIRLQPGLASRFRIRPKISIITPVFNPDRKTFAAMLDSVSSQTYENWELCLADASSQPHVKELIQTFIRNNRKKTNVRFLEKNLGITGNSNAALSLATGDYVALLDHDDTLAPFALFEVAQVINEHSEVDIVYSDRDIISYDGHRMYPFFKPDWSPDYLLSQNYLCHLIVFRKMLLDRIGGFREGYEGSQDYDLFLRATEAAHKIVHIPKVLYHWRIVHGSASVDPTAKPYAYEAAIRALQDAFDRRGQKGVVSHGITRGFYDLKFLVDDEPRVSVIVPSTGEEGMLKAALGSVLRKSNYKNYEIVVVDSGKRTDGLVEYCREIAAFTKVRIFECEESCNVSEDINAAVSSADAEYVAVMTGTVEVMSEDWIERLLGFVRRDGTGAAGGKLIGPDGRIYASGLVLTASGEVRRAHHGYPADSPGYNGWIQSVHNVSALEGCVMIARQIYEEIGGFDARFASCGLVDLCLALRSKDYLIVYDPNVELYYYCDCPGEIHGTAEFRIGERERELFLEKWQPLFEAGDPYYNSNLTQEKEDFSLRI